MKPSKWEVVILKPTPVFQSFIASQFEEADAPNIRLMLTDTTAYVIPKRETDEKTLDEIEKHYEEMFSHEIQRWLGDEAHHHMEGSFLDFLCCFKFELHSQIVVMEECIEAGHQLIRIRPRSVILKWMKSAIERNDDKLVDILQRVNVSHLAENATVVVKNFQQLTEVQPFLEMCYEPIFRAEMSRMSDNPSQWPVIDSYNAFCRYFAVDIHTQMIHLH